MTNKKEEIKEVCEMFAILLEIDCPHCQKRQSGFFGNPAGGEFNCDDCKKPYKIHKDADIECYM